MPGGKRAAGGASSVDFDRERELIRQENAELVSQGVMSKEDAEEAESQLGIDNALPAKKRVKLSAGAKMMKDVASNLDDLKFVEKVKYYIYTCAVIFTKHFI